MERCQRALRAVPCGSDPSTARGRAAALLVAAAALCHAIEVSAATDYRIVTAPERSVGFRMGQDLARHVAPAASIDLDVLPSAGPVENVRRLLGEPGVKFALVHSDVQQAYLDRAAAGDREAAKMMRPLRVIAPLHDDAIHFIVRADAPWTFVHEIRNARLNAGAPESATALTVSTLYRRMFGAPPPVTRTSHLAHEDALVRLVTDRSVDVVVVVADQPSRLLARMTPEARKHVKLLAVDPAHAATKAALRTYVPTTLRAASYPNLLDADLPALAVKTLLVTYDFDLKPTGERLRDFASSLCTSLGTLREHGHPRWKDVDLSLPSLGSGWLYYLATEPVLLACTGAPPRSQPTTGGRDRRKPSRK